MNRCYLCDTEADIQDQDNGRRKVVRCPNCKYYEIVNLAILKIENPGFQKQAKQDLARIVENINSQKKEPEIVFDGKTVRVREKLR